LFTSHIIAEWKLHYLKGEDEEKVENSDIKSLSEKLRQAL
jgi:hypothetical protein